MSMVARQIQHQQQTEVKTKKVVRRHRSRITLGEKIIGLTMTVVAFAMIGLMLHNYASIYTLNKDVHQLQGTISQQSQVNEGLSLQVVELSAPDRILDIATGELGMSLDDNKVKVVQN
ncbi:cell division protein FtsL [Alkalihalophilus lindianensis]|uniref:Cell division protein FtsL n=1 Tax=Alkalihalophilus lindianensis TaxID=1630542 RepID=A0ABU3XBR4_9BACI|nr:MULTISPECIES: cell division protein FtsL [Bacillaceae]KMJ55442.1 cell division protein FtsL [Bacillus sp. LL01]MDV2685328.1 cell division protein FtsL [Alkalihalophilus lindianensis]